MGKQRGLPVPCSLEAERAVLGAVMLDPTILGDVLSILRPSDFFNTAHVKIFEAMERLHVANKPIDFVTLGGELGTSGTLAEIGGPMVLSQLTDAVATSANALHYAGIVRDRAVARRVTYYAQNVVTLGQQNKASDEIAMAVEALVHETETMIRSHQPTRLTDLGDAVLANYMRVADGFTGIPYPWKSVTDMTAGIWPQTLTMFVARPSVGKTMVAMLVARHAWMQGYPVLLVSPEMSRDEMAERYFVIEAAVSYLATIKGKLSGFQVPKLIDAVQRMKAKDRLWIMDSQDDLTPRGIEAAIRACAPMRQGHDEKPLLVAIDSIYDIRFRGDRRERVQQAIDWMKTACKRMRFACVGFAQQSRLAELSEKKGGGARLGTIALADEVGQDSHAVFALEQTKDQKADRRMRIKPLKLRRGYYGGDAVEVHWDFERMVFDEIGQEAAAEFSDADSGELPF